jgi:hypothetical protein
MSATDALHNSCCSFCCSFQTSMLSCSGSRISIGPLQAMLLLLLLLRYQAAPCCNSCGVNITLLLLVLASPLQVHQHPSPLPAAAAAAEVCYLLLLQQHHGLRWQRLHRFHPRCQHAWPHLLLLLLLLQRSLLPPPQLLHCHLHAQFRAQRQQHSSMQNHVQEARHTAAALNRPGTASSHQQQTNTSAANEV